MANLGIESSSIRISRRPKYSGLIIFTITAMMGFFPGLALRAAIHEGEIYTLKQPDGTYVPVRVWGDEFYQRVESLDGYTLIRDRQTRRICYARLSADESEFIATDVVYRGTNVDEGLSLAAQMQVLSQPRHLELKSEAIRAKVNQARMELYGAANESELGAAAQQDVQFIGELTGAVLGLTLLIEFPDEPNSISREEIENYCNQPGYAHYGNNGSVQDYFYDVSNGLLTYTNYVTEYYTAQHEKAYYTDPNIPYGTRARELIHEALACLDGQGFDFSILSTNSSGRIRALNAFYAGAADNAWSEGLWPHKWYLTPTFYADGVQSGDYQITNIGSSLQLSTFCHENGHMLFGWPDLYDYDHDSNGIGRFGIMCSSGSSTNPIPPCAYLRWTAGWETLIEISDMANGTRLGLQSNSFATYRYSHPTNIQEFFLIESRLKTGRNTYLADEGLIIWHVDEAGSNNYQQMTPAQHYKVSVEQADGLFELEYDINNGGAGDLFHADYADHFDDTTIPDAKWWSGEDSGLNINHISPVGETMYFSVGPEFIVDPETVWVPEGATAEFTVALAYDPAGTVEATVSIESGDPNIIIISGTTLTFNSANYMVGQPVTLAALEDDDYLNGSCRISISAVGLFTVWVTAIEADNDSVAGILFVDEGANIPDAKGSSWADAFSDLEEALAAAANRSEITEIRVAQGSYIPDATGLGDPREAAFTLVNEVVLRGGYAGWGAADPNGCDPNIYITKLSGDLGAAGEISDNCYHVITVWGCDPNTILDGFMITGGYAFGSDMYDSGGGVYSNSSYAAFNNCVFVNNAAAFGGGMYNDENSHLSLNNCIFRENIAAGNGGGIHNCNSSPTLTRCRFDNNTADYGGGMYNRSDSSPTLIDCIFIGNKAGYAGGMRNYSNSNPVLINCIFSGNSVEKDGGGMHNSGSSPSLVNCSFSENTARTNGGGMCNDDSNPVITNSIFWGNRDKSGTTEAGQIYADSGTPIVNYNCIQQWSGIWGGLGNIGADPRFMDANGADNLIGTLDDNLRLWPGSAGIDAGDNRAVPANITTDIDDNLRFEDDPCLPDTGSGMPPIVDMGAYEGPRQGFILSYETLMIPEGAGAEFTVALAMKPAGAVEAAVAVVAGDPNITITSGAALTFNSANYSVPQTVALAAGEDEDNLNGTALINISAAGMITAGITGIEEDNEPFPNILYVDSSVSIAGARGTNWSDALASLYEALSLAAQHGQVRQIRVAQGIYKPDPTGLSDYREAGFSLVNGVGVYGGFPSGGGGWQEQDPIRNITILSGDIGVVDDNSDNCYHVVVSLNTDPNTVLDGFTITGGNANGLSMYEYGGGMYNYQGSLTLVNCHFIGNSALTNGGGMYNHINCHPTLVNCVFSENSSDYGGGLYCREGCHPILTDCIFSGNSAAYGGGIRLYDNCRANLTNCCLIYNSATYGGAMHNSIDCCPTLTQCVIMGNSATNNAGGIYNHTNSHSVLTECIISSNAADYGGGMYNRVNSRPVLRNCLISGNSANFGGGIRNYDSSPEFYNCTISGNLAHQTGGGIYNNDNSRPKLLNCIIWGNIDNEVENEATQTSGGAPTIDYSCLYGWTGSLGGGGNINTDPNFADPGYWDPNGTAGNSRDDFWIEGDFHLRSQAGRWEPVNESWVIDAEHSPGIDAGKPWNIPDPNSDWRAELWPHGGRINMGAYGGTAQASMSLSQIGNIADLNGDGVVDLNDWGLFSDKWMWEKVLLAADLDRNGAVALRDLFIFIDNWLAKNIK